MTPAASACIVLLLRLASCGRRRRCCRFFSRSRLLVSEVGEIGTVHAAQIAATALLRMDHVRSVITLSVESRGERQNFCGTELHAETAGLTALHHDLHRTFSHCCPFLSRGVSERNGSHSSGLFLCDFAVAPGGYVAVGKLTHLPGPPTRAAFARVGVANRTMYRFLTMHCPRRSDRRHMPM